MRESSSRPRFPTAAREAPRIGRLKQLLRSRGFQVLAGAAVLGVLLLATLEELGGPDRIRADFGYSAVALLLPLQVVVAVTPVPSEIVVLAVGAIYGLVGGTAFAWMGWMLANWLQLALFRRVARDLDVDERDRLPAWLRRLPAHHPLFLVGARWLPYGGHMVNAVAAAHGVPLWRFTWTVALALVPPAILFAAIANGLLSW